MKYRIFPKSVSLIPCLFFSFLLSPLVHAQPDKNDNPYATSLNEWLTEKHEADIKNLDLDNSYARNIGQNIIKRSWGLTHPLSRLSGTKMESYHQERLAQEMEYIIKLGQKYNGRFTSIETKNNIERFVLRNVLDAVYRLREKELYPDKLQRWIDDLWLPVHYQYINYRHYPEQTELSVGNNRSAGSYPNADAMYVLLMGLAAELYDYPAYAERAREFTEYLEEHLLEGGGFNYAHLTNDIPGYHGLVISCLARYWTVSGDSLALSLLKRSEDYYPLSFNARGFTEKTSYPWWKRQMGISAGKGPLDIVASITGDGRNKYLALLDYPANADAIAVDYWRDDIVPVKPEYGPIYPDPNIEGFRGDFGNFSWLATRGHHGPVDAFVGAMITDYSDEKPRMSSMMECVIAEVGMQNQRTYYLTGTDSPGDYVFNDKMGAIALSYHPHDSWKSRTDDGVGKDLPWTITQLWLMLPGEVHALLEMKSDKDQKAEFIRTRIRMHPHQELKRKSEKIFTANRLRLQLNDHDFDTLSYGTTRQRGETFSKSRVGDEIVLFTPGRTFKKDEVRRLTLSVFPEWEDGICHVEELKMKELKCMKVSSRKELFFVVFNSNETAASFLYDEKGNWEILSNLDEVRKIRGTISEMIEPGEVVLIGKK